MKPERHDWQWTIFNGWTKWKSWNFSFSRNARIHGSRHRAAMPWRQQSRTVQARGDRMTRQRAEDQQLYNRPTMTSWAHRGSLATTTWTPEPPFFSTHCRPNTSSDVTCVLGGSSFPVTTHGFSSRGVAAVRARRLFPSTISGVGGSVPVLPLGRKLDWQRVLSCAPKDPHLAVLAAAHSPLLMCTLFCAFNTCVSCITLFLGLAAYSHSSKNPPSLAYCHYLHLPNWTVCAGVVGVALSAKSLNAYQFIFIMCTKTRRQTVYLSWPQHLWWQHAECPPRLRPANGQLN